MLAIALAALGNRTWGSSAGGHLLGAALMTFATIIANPGMWMWSPVIFIALLCFRVWTVRPWLDETHGTITSAAILRGGAVLPYAALLFYLDHRLAHLIIGACFPVIALIYWLAGRQSRVEPVALAECLTGAFIGACAM